VLYNTIKNRFEDIVTILLDVKAPTTILNNTHYTLIYYTQKNRHLKTFTRLFKGYYTKISSRQDVNLVNNINSLVIEYY
jgi:hypothetical protein